jgi:acid phosphatase (class A)
MLKNYSHGAALLAVTLFSVSAWAAPDAETVRHPAPKEPSYISKDWYTTLKESLPPPPQAGSQGQKRDEETLFALQRTRNDQDCKAAHGEVFVNLGNFFGSPRGVLDNGTVDKLGPFFEKVRNDADYFIQKLKKDFPRKRPFVYLERINPCVPREVTDAYPSGHAVLSKLFALILSDAFPEKREQLDSRSIEIGRHRVLSGMHHPSDVDAGRQAAQVIYDKLKQSAGYQADLGLALKSIGR